MSLSESQRIEIENRLRAGQSKRSTSRDVGVSYYQVHQLSNELYGAQSDKVEQALILHAPSLTRIDAVEEGHIQVPVDQEEAGAELEPVAVVETVTNPESGAEVDYMRVTQLSEIEQEHEYLVAAEPILPSKQAGTEKFDSVAMQENPEIAEFMYNPPTASPTQYTEDGRSYIRRRVEWHGHEFAEPGIQIDGEPVTEEVGLDAARELPGWYEDPETGKRTYVVQFHPDTPENLLAGEPDTMEPTGKLPGGYQYEPMKGVIFRRKRIRTPEEMEIERYLRNQRLIAEHLG